MKKCLKCILLFLVPLAIAGCTFCALDDKAKANNQSYGQYGLNIEIAQITDPLVAASAKGDLSRVRELVDSGYPVNTISDVGYSPLSIAVKVKHTAIVLYLIENGADVLYVDHAGLLPLETAVYGAEVGENIDIVEALVMAGADPDAKTPESIQTPREAARYVNANDLLDAMKRGELRRSTQ